ncbi:hypothetical protein ACIRL2_51080 [Embleya sp. NPDC127516]|uniref:hypothetical protein n=1 Tax=Embleya sp. NPDC127516 TaxID=3363990 RepID=UPI00380C07BF
MGVLPEERDQHAVFPDGQIARVEGDEFGGRRVAGVSQEHERAGTHTRRRGAIDGGHRVTQTRRDETIETKHGAVETRHRHGLTRHIGSVNHRTFLPDPGRDVTLI